MPITVEDRTDFVRKCTALSVWLARRLAVQGMALREALAIRTNIYRFTTLFDGQHHPAYTPGWRDEKWERVLDRLEAIDRRYPAGDATPEMEAEALEFLWPLMEGRIESDVAAWKTPEQKPFGFFDYRAGDEGWDEGRVTLHLSNPFPPASPFDDMRERARELARLLRHAQGQCSDVHTVSCGSWLSSFGPFRSLFPASFAASAATPYPLAHHYGWWGQMMDRRGGFHEGNGMYLRRTGEFRYPCITCRCSIDDAVRHLRERFAVDAVQGVEGRT